VKPTCNHSQSLRLNYAGFSLLGKHTQRASMSRLPTGNRNIANGVIAPPPYNNLQKEIVFQLLHPILRTKSKNTPK